MKTKEIQFNSIYFCVRRFGSTKKQKFERRQNKEI